MKTLIIRFFGAALLASIIFISCNKETEKQPESYDLETYCKTIGAEHNRGLEYVYEQLKEEKLKTGKIEGSDVLELAKRHTIDFLEMNQSSFVKDNIDISISGAQKAFIWVENEYSFNSRTFENSNSDQLWPQEIEDSLTAKQKELLTILNNAINDKSLDLNATLSIFDNVKERVKNECTQEEIPVLFAAIGIGVNSLTYWNNNFDKWMVLASTTTNKAANVCDSCISWKQIGKVDVASGVGAAAGVGVANFFGPTGWAVFGAATLGSAVGGSVTDAILQFWN